jgi:hypothetical protein
MLPKEARLGLGKSRCGTDHHRAAFVREARGVGGKDTEAHSDSGDTLILGYCRNNTTGTNTCFPAVSRVTF